MDHTLKVAIAHSNAGTRHVLHTAIAQLGHAVCVHAGTGAELIDSSQRPDLVIVQETLPDRDGLQAVREACGDVAIPTILVLDPKDGRQLVQPEAANVLAVLHEPVRSSDLIPVIPLVMQRFAELQALRKEIADLSQPLEEWSNGT